MEARDLIAVMKAAGDWKVHPKPSQDRRETIECPVCKGSLHLIQYARNGHAHGRCDTPGCVIFME